MNACTLERALNLPDDALATATATELLVLDALRPAGHVVPWHKFVGDQLKTVSNLGPRLEAVSAGRLGVIRVPGIGFYLWDEQSDDWIETETLRSSRTALVAEIGGQRCPRLSVSLAFLLEPLARAHLRGPWEYASRRELCLALGSVTRPPPGLDAGYDLELDLDLAMTWHFGRMRSALTRLRHTINVRIPAISELGYLLALPQQDERTDP